MKLGALALAIANVLLFGLLGWLILCQGLPLTPSKGWEYKDLIAALLTVVTIAMTFIGLAIALAAIWGWQTISQGAARKAAIEALAQNKDHLESDAFKTALRLLVVEQIENEKKAAVQNAVVGESVTEQAPEGPEGDEAWQD